MTRHCADIVSLPGVRVAVPLPQILPLPDLPLEAVEGDGRAGGGAAEAPLVVLTGRIPGAL